MGSVYLAVRDDKEFRKRAAIKLIRRGMDTDEILLRFRTERQILAGLTHPNIAGLLDGGTTDDGLPYFVMEYVEGIPVDAYCDEQKLNTIDRLKLFRTICSAVHAAHQNLVVHRDLKPGNILVTADGNPKLLDFGIAKLLNPEMAPHTVAATALNQRPMTPAYASPEQIRGGSITTSSDIYSLGVILYRLLTGHSPYRLKDQTLDLERIICEQEPEKPSTAISRVEEISSGGASIILTPESVSKTRDDEPDKLRRRLRGDLDNIILMAMRKEPQRRYASVDQFSEDIRRYMDGLPVIARGASLGYRSAKFVKRNKTLVAAAALLLLTLVGGIIATTREAQIARIERARAERRFNDVRKLANSFMFEMHDAIQNLPGSTRARSLLVTRALEYLDSLAQEAGNDTSLQRELATAYQKVGDVQGNPYVGNLGDRAGALSSYKKAMAIRESIYKAAPADFQAQRDLAVSYGRTADVLRSSGDTTGALDYSRKSLDLCERISAANPADEKDRFDLSSAIERAGDNFASAGDTNAALAQFRRALDIREALSARNPSNAESRRGISIACSKMANLMAMSGNIAGAMESYQKALAIRQALSLEDTANAKFRRELSSSWVDVGYLYWMTDRTKQAIAHYGQALSIREDLVREDPRNAQANRDLAVIHGYMGTVLSETGDRRGASQSMRKSLVIFEGLAARDPEDAQAQRDLFLALINNGDMKSKANDFTGALADYGKALATSESLAVRDSTNAMYRRDLAKSHFSLGEIHAALAASTKTPEAERQEEWRRAKSHFQKCRNIYQEMRDRGEFKSAVQAFLDQAADALAKCETALSGF
jgi:non-specific serine/threonine protein kinase/serine/threonine-protein kinase